ncbi:MAG: AAA family ATPase [Aquidulcibacter sp.]|nr:AAA family ATPase [Aquidulcibacter sp.]
MPLSTEFTVPTYNGNLNIAVKAGSSIVLIGANGSGKTRLGVHIDTTLSGAGTQVHRIAAHRSLILNPNVIPPSSEIALNRLHYGSDGGNHHHKIGHRYQGQPATMLLNDFDHVIAALYAENNDVSIRFREACLANPEEAKTPPMAKVDRLKIIWQTTLPHRDLVVLSGNIKTKPKIGSEYSSSDMSDGERVIFYLIAQALLAKPDTLLIFDEPELHLNRSIISKLWDAIESARPDCAFLYITHDVEFGNSRRAASKYAIREYRKEPAEAWDILQIPDNEDLPDEILTKIIGSRLPILFIEGNDSSIDISIYRRLYSQFTVVPVGSCENVIHTVSTFMARPDLHRLGCAGLIDADGRTAEEIKYLEEKCVFTLSVAEVENLILLPDVFKAIAKSLHFSEEDANAKLVSLKSSVMTLAQQHLDQICIRRTKRLVDSAMKKIGLEQKDVAKLDLEFKTEVNKIDILNIYNEAKKKIEDEIRAENYETVLAYFDNKGLLVEASKHLDTNKKTLEQFLGRVLGGDSNDDLRNAILSSLPNIQIPVN